MAPIPAPTSWCATAGPGSRRRGGAPGRARGSQRCLFHAFCQVRRYTTSRPRLQAGRELYALAVELMNFQTLRQAEWWVERYLQWCGFWADFLEDVSYVDGSASSRTRGSGRRGRRSLGGERGHALHLPGPTLPKCV